MNSEEIIKVIDELCKKFGVAIDWTAQNVWPYIQEIGQKIVTYKIVSNSIWTIISFLLLIFGIFAAKKLFCSYFDCYKTHKENQFWKYWKGDCLGTVDTSPLGTAALTVTICVGIIFTPLFIVSLIKLFRWIFIPEIQLIQYVQNLLS